MHPVNTRLDQTTRERGEGIACVDSDGPILGLDPLPLTLCVQDLECSYRLSEQKSNCSQICVAGTVELADLLVIFSAAGCIVHIAQMVLALDVVLVVAD